MTKLVKVIGVCYGTAAVLLTIWGIGHYFSLDKESWPAWVQAVGSIGSIWGAVYLSHRESTRAQRDEQANSLRTLHLLNQEAIQFALNLGSQLNKPSHEAIRFDSVAFEGIRSGLSQIPSSGLDAKMLGCMFKLKDILGQVYDEFSVEESVKQSFQRSQRSTTLRGHRRKMSAIQGRIVEAMTIRNIQPVDLASVSDI